MPQRNENEKQPADCAALELSLLAFRAEPATSLGKATPLALPDQGAPVRWGPLTA